MIDEKTLKTLEYNKILAIIASFAQSQQAKEHILGLKPLDDVSLINRLLDEVFEADRVLYVHSVSPSFACDDISNALERAAIMSTLSMGDLLKIARVLRVSQAINSSILKIPDDTVVLLKQIAKCIYSNATLEEDISRAILSDTEMNDNASSDLREIRIKIRKKGEGIKAKLYSYINSSTYQKILQDNLITVRGDRYVIPVKAEYRSNIPGLIHDQSASGATVYIEPMAIVEMNNELKSLLIEEEIEIDRILRAFTLRVSLEGEKISQSLENIIELDTIFTKAKYSNLVKGVRPIINENGFVNIIKGRHPLIPKDKVVSTTISLGKDYQMLFITGPNTGGKTVCLKLVGLFVLLATSGIFLPASEAEIPLFDGVFCDIGDEQSIEQNLSTFSSHMSNITNILNRISENSLILLDELGAGTDPTEGASLALSISNFILRKGSKAVITTHYNELKEYAVVIDGAQNASMDFDITTYSPTYHLTIGTPGVSNALLIAEKLGLNKEIIKEAKEGIKSQKLEFENVVVALEKAKQAAINDANLAEKLRNEAEKLHKEAELEKEKLYAQRERLNDSVKKETKRLVENAMEEANEIIDELRELLENPDEGTIFKAQKLRKSLKKYIISEDNEFSGTTDEIEGEIEEGDLILVKSLNSEGTVVSINKQKGEAKIKMGGVTSTAKLNNLIRLKAKKAETTEKSKQYSPDNRFLQLNNSQARPELNIVGKTTAEAQPLLEEFLYNAVAQHLKEIKIIHGYGTGALKFKVHTFLRENRKFIVTFRLGNYNEGGAGVTIVTLK